MCSSVAGQMMDGFNRQVLRVAVAQICQSMGWDAVQKSTHDTLTDVLQRYLEEIGKVAYSYTQICNRTNPNLDDLHLAFQDTGVVLNELENYVAQVDPVQFIHPFTAYPRCKPCRLQHPSCGEIVDRAEFYSEHLPPLPTICHEEPKDEEKEIPTEGNTKVVVPETNEKMKASPLKELNQVPEKSDHNIPVKRRGDTAIFLPDSKRARLDLPANLNLEKKENLENTDGESLSPATPVSPYLPQEVPKSPEKSKKVTDVAKMKTEPKSPVLMKEMVLPLKKLTPPDRNPKVESSPSTPKKSKVIKTEKSGSPKFPKKSPSPIPPRGSPLSGQRQAKPEKKSPSPKLTSPGKTRSPLKEKTPVSEKAPVREKKPVSEKAPVGEKPPGGEKAPSSEKLPGAAVTKKMAGKLSEKLEPSLKSPPKGSPIKSPPSAIVVKKEKDLAGTKAWDDKPPKAKKKKKPLGEPQALKAARPLSPRTEALSTPKLMIKLLPKSEAECFPEKVVPKGQQGLATPVKAEKTPTTSEAKKKIKVKVKKRENPEQFSENIGKPVEKIKLSTGLVESLVKKEHSKKKKKKKDRDKEKHKTFKIDKAEPPIPKIRFKFDASGESKVVETKPTVPPKIITSLGQTSSKKSSIVIETEKVSRSIITQTLSSNTLDYDPGKAYFCPVCKKQDDGSPMVGCDGCDEWCHWACVGLIAAPPEDEEWHCPQCLLRREKTKKGKSKKKSKEHV